MNYEKLKISSKLAIGFAAVILFAVFIGAVGMVQLKVLDDRDTMLYERGVMPLNYLVEIVESFQGTRASIRDVLRGTDAAVVRELSRKVEADHQIIDENLKKLEPTFISSEGRDLFQKMLGPYHDYVRSQNEIIQLVHENKHKEGYQVLDGRATRDAKIFQEAFDAVHANKVQAAKALSDENTIIAQRTAMSMFVLMIIGCTVAIIFAVYISRSITTILTKISENLRDSSDQVASAAGELASASNQLSDSSSEQAAAIEETSSSLEELSGMVQNNVGSAAQAFELANNVKNISEEGATAMSHLEAAMKEILVSNQKIEELVKVINNIGEKTEVMDEIVFQTKLLSFNASVEAERAGDHGRGFAVVAQEVGNLAQMSGKAAQEIAAIVKDSMATAQVITNENKKKVEQGSGYVTETADSLKAIVKAVDTVAAAAKQVLDASKDQAQGISQINIAMTSVDKATQENAATAEEAASSSEELSAQTGVLHDVVLSLMALVHGEKAAHENAGLNIGKNKTTSRAKIEKHTRSHKAARGSSSEVQGKVIQLKKAQKSGSRLTSRTTHQNEQVEMSHSRSVQKDSDGNATAVSVDPAEAWEKL